MSRWRYARDPVCIVSCMSYAANRWLIPFAWKGPFMRGHFNDLFLVPAALPPVLWLYRRLSLREHDNRPRWDEILWHVVVWSIATEWVGPHLFSRATGDIFDVLAYAGGAGLAGILWHRDEL